MEDARIDNTSCGRGVKEILWKERGGVVFAAERHGSVNDDKERENREEITIIIIA